MYKNNSVDMEMKNEISKSYINNLSVEMKFLGCLIKWPMLIIEIQDLILPNYFLYSVNNVIFSSMMKIFLNIDEKSKKAQMSFSYDALFSKNVDMFSSKEIITSYKNLKYDSLIDYYNAICSSNFDMKEFKDYTAIVKENGLRHLLYNTARDSQLALINFDSTKNAENIIEKYTKDQLDIVVNAHNEDSFKKIGTIGNNFIDRITKRITNKERVGISTGFDVLDNAINFLQRGCLYTIAARPKTGKSTILLKLAANIVEQNIPVLYIDTELDTETEVIPRMLSLYSRVNNYWITNGSFVNVPEEKLLVEEAAKRIMTLPFYHIYKPGIGIAELVSLIKMWVLREVGSYLDPITGHTRTKDCVVIFDYLKVVKRTSKILKDYQILGDMTTTLKDLAGKYGFPCITAVQNNRASVKDMAGEVVNAETAVAGSDEILQFTNYLLFMDEIRSFSRIQTGMNNGTYHSYIPDMSDEKFKAKFNSAVVEVEKEIKNKCIEGLIGNRLLSLVAGRGSASHDDNNFFTLMMDFEHADLQFTGELAYKPLGKRYKG